MNVHSTVDQREIASQPLSEPGVVYVYDHFQVIKSFYVMTFSSAENIVFNFLIFYCRFYFFHIK